MTLINQLLKVKGHGYFSVGLGETVVGIISIGDLVKSIIDDQRFTIGQLETYFRDELYVH